MAETATEATLTADRIFDLRERHRSALIEHQVGTSALTLISLLFTRPIVNVKLVQSELGVAWGTANKLVGQFEELGFLEEITGQKRSRVFRYDSYLDLFDEPEVGDDHTQAESGFAR